MNAKYQVFNCFIVLYFAACDVKSSKENDVVVFTVATNDTDSLRRYVRFEKINGIDDNIKIFGFGEAWKGRNFRKYVEGGQKIHLFKKALQEYKDDTEKIIIFTDCCDLLFLLNLDEILEKFKKFDSRIVFSVGSSCWTNKSLAEKYPSITEGKGFLNAGGIIGYSNDLYYILSDREIEDGGDEQLFFTKIYLDPKLREKHKIKLDNKSKIFQNLYGAVADVELRFKGNDIYLQNTAYGTALNENGISKIALNYHENYLAQGWSPEEGCLNCWDDPIELSKNKPETYPVILIAIFIEKPMPFLEEFFEKIYTQTYLKSKLHIFIYNYVSYHKDVVDNFIEKHGDEYESVKKVVPDDGIDEVTARNLAMDYCLLEKCSGYFSIDAQAHLDNKRTIISLVEQQKGIVAPLLTTRFEAWSNFWGVVSDYGFYAHSYDYMQIINHKRRGLWNVPFISSCYLINSTIISNKETRPLYSKGDLDLDMTFSSANRERLIFMYVSNRLEFGHQVTSDSFNTTLSNPDLYQIFDNKLDWEKRYIHENYSKNLEEGQIHLQPCPDVYWFPIINARMANEIIEIMENFGQWSDGSNEDTRLEGFYEAVPTRDIHANQVNFERQWLYFLKEYVRPLQKLVFAGHNRYPPTALLNFVVRYKIDEQSSLMPHQDFSNYTINIALNKAGVDYEGGGCRFIIDDCAVTDTKQGWTLLHPGSHIHEGIPVTKGTRYIMISFIDPSDMY
ncbi:procollagen-lysine,2-oxoglutarate 5-dioxygenase-like [Belonocnema kinseyi]|uniref:procollagen-lysine,2-oxoglutarate 5-dioxygenase-like n=1 Tax=Belonocnema kinseyi TaxID=2817044 RepID=UPI00143D157B|nr:procollagen-lysine,2-oxoglutarate 5-dioxygenase-like [Belonocnema kinseyi]